MKSKRLTAKDLEKRLVIKLDKTIKRNGVNGIMLFGENNDYPQIIEMSVNGSVTAKSAASIYAKFLTGGGFENEAINDIVVGRDQRGKGVTMMSLLRQVSDSCAIHNGFYLHRNTNLQGETGSVHLKPFKDGRFSKPDDTGFSAKIVFYNNWGKDNDIGRFDNKKAVEYPLFSSDIKITQEHIKEDRANRGQIYFQFLDNQYFYPLSPFDAAYMDVDTEQQIALYKNRQLRNGFFDKVLIRMQEGYKIDGNGQFLIDDNGNRVIDDGISESVMSFIGADGETVLVLTDDVDPDTGEFPKNTLQIEKITGNINDKLFDSWEKSIADNIRKAPRNIPNLLINIEDGMFSGQSGEAIKQATAFYNAMTRDDRALISSAFKDIFSLSTNPILKNNDNWKIKPLELIEDANSNTTATASDKTN